MIAYNFHAAGKDASGRASVGQGKLLSPEDPGPPFYRAQLAAGGERLLLNHLLAALGKAFPATLLARYYVALKTKPFLVLTGPEGAGKAALATGFAAAVVGADSGQIVTIGSDSWAGRGTQSSYYRGIHERFGVTQLLETLNEAASPESAGKAFFVMLKGLTLDELHGYLGRLLAVDEQGKRRLILPGVPAAERPLMPSNCFITATLHTALGARPLDKLGLQHAGQIELSLELHAAVTPPSLPPPPVGLQRLMLSAAGRARRRGAPAPELTVS
jgi:hypothetical protein